MDEQVAMEVMESMGNLLRRVHPIITSLHIFQMSTFTREELKEVVEEVIFSSHNAIAKVQSNGYAEIDKKLAVLTSKFDTMYEDNKVRNGAFRGAVEMFQKKFDIQDKINESFSGWRNYTVGAVSIITIVGLPVLGYIGIKLVDIIQTVDKLTK